MIREHDDLIVDQCEKMLKGAGLDIKKFYSILELL